jgi:hypothetical protein
MIEKLSEIEDFLSGNFVKSFTDGECRIYEFDKEKITIESKNDFNGNPTRVLRYHVLDIESMSSTWKIWDLSRAHANVYKELMKGNGGKGWTVMKITRIGLNKKTTYKVEGVR